MCKNNSEQVETKESLTAENLEKVSGGHPLDGWICSNCGKTFSCPPFQYKCDNCGCNVGTR